MMCWTVDKVLPPREKQARLACSSASSFTMSWAMAAATAGRNFAAGKSTVTTQAQLEVLRREARRVLYDFTSEDPCEMSTRAGDLVIVQVCLFP